MSSGQEFKSSRLLESSRGKDEEPSSVRELSRPISQYSQHSRKEEGQFKWQEDEKLSQGLGTPTVGDTGKLPQSAPKEREPPRNPFKMPTDEEIFALRDDERKRKKEEREKVKLLKVHEKSTWSTRMGTTHLRVDGDDGLGDDDEATKKAKSKANLLAMATQALGNDRRKEKENMADFIAKKREMFLVQMSLDTKRAEIRKLEELALQREEALKKNEQMLEEDAMRFDAFLKENDMKAVEAIKRAESETKAKQDKVQEIKKLNAQIAAIKSEMSKYEEQLEDCRKYKEFLDKLTPPEWFREQMELKAKRRAERKARRMAEREAAESARLAAEVAAKEKAEKDRPKWMSPAARLEWEKKEKERQDKERTDKEKQDKEKLDRERIQQDDDDYSSGEELPMYFSQPQQLLDIFTALEESNLFLIQNSQETEEALEELKAKKQETQARMDSETKALQKQIESLRAQIKAEEDKATQLTEKAKQGTSSNVAGGIEEHDKTLQELNQRIADVYARISNETDAPIDAVQALTNIEAMLEEFLSIIAQMPVEYVESAEKQKEKERRQRVRQEKLELQKKLQEERIKRSLERSKAPATKKSGKAVMFRSPPLVKRKKDKDLEGKQTSDDEDYEEFFRL